MSKADDYFIAGMDGLARVGRWLCPVGAAISEVACRLLAYAFLVALTPFVFINWLCGGSND